MPSTSESLIDRTFLEAARHIGDERVKEAVVQGDGSVSWHDGYARDFSAIPDAGIFNARAGEALFLAALYSATKDEHYREVAARAVAPLMRRLEDPSSCRALTDSIGFGVTGIGSIIYCCLRMARWLERPELADGAVALANSLTADVIRSDDKLEVFWGTAGLLLGLLSASEAGAEPFVTLAQICGDHLLSRRSVDSATGIRAWRTSADAPHVGFAHGSTGVAYALLRLYRATPRRAYYDAAIEAFAWESART
jgi:lantibiotic modifying enzyme